MNRFHKSFWLAGVLVLALSLSLGACDITDLNQNPNASPNVTTPNLLTNAQYDLANIYWNDYPGAFWVRYAQYLTTNQYTEADRWEFDIQRSGSNDANWNDSYLLLNDLQQIIRINRQEGRRQDAAAFGPNANQIAIAMILQAYTYHKMTDMWGPIPYNEALQGRQSGNFTPAYTPQPEIYQGLIDSLTAASNMIDASQTTLASGDLVFGGDMSKWKKLANSLKMRVAIRAADANPGLAEQAINEAINAGVMESNADNATIPFSSAPPYRNNFFVNYEVEGRDDWAAPASIVGQMKAVNDPRLGSYFSDATPSTPSNEYNGFPYGLPGGEAQSLFASGAFSRPSERVRGEATAPAFIMFYDEVLFTKAEAAERGFISGDPAQFYRDAITASLDRWDAGGDASAYISRVPYDNSNGWAPVSGVGETWESTLGIQKWLALYFQGIQGWAEWRRLDFQEVLQVPQDNPGQEMFGCDFPLRMVYPQNELSVNEESYNAAIGSDGILGGPDDQGTALWWDTQTPSCN